MPTGILRDVWSSLSSLGDRADGEASRLEKLWIRWHKSPLIDGNYELPQALTPGNHSFPQSASSRSSNANTATVDQHPRHVNKVEKPTFSCISPLKSLTVLDIDELEYLDQMATLITKSRDQLHELRVGIALDAMGCEWINAYEGGGLRQTPSASERKLGASNWDKRLGGVFGVLFSGIYDIREQHKGLSQMKRNPAF